MTEPTPTRVPPSYRAGRSALAVAIVGALATGCSWSVAAGLPADLLAWCERIATLGWFWTW